MESGLNDVLDGRSSFDDFATEYDGQVTALSKWLYAKWQVPFCVSVDDIKQEVLAALAAAIVEWDETSPMSLYSYAVWCACTAAKRFINTQRCALRRSDKAPSRHPVVFTALRYENEPDDAFEQRITLLLGYQEPTQEVIVDTLAYIGRMRESLTTERDRIIFTELMRQRLSVNAVVDTILTDEALSLRLNLRSRDTARRVVNRALERALEYGE